MLRVVINFFVIWTVAGKDMDARWRQVLELASTHPWRQTDSVKPPRDSPRYTALSDNVYHLFTRDNPSVSQPLVYGDGELVQASNFNSSRGTAVVIHGWQNNATSDVNTVLVPAFLTASDLNVLVVDWSAGAADDDYYTAVDNCVTSGVAVATFIAWLNGIVSANVSQYHLVGHSLGGHQAGIVGRNLGGEAPYITGLDPAGPGWEDNSNRFQSTDGLYTEVIHTNAGVLGYLDALGDVDFYPNGGSVMPGCASVSCNHGRSFFYFAESLISGGFTGTAFNSTADASSETLEMGGLEPKTGSYGIYYVETNASPPFSIS